MQQNLAWKKHSKSNRIHHVSFKYAFKGLKTAFNTQPNFRFHTFALFVLVIVSFLLREYLTIFDYVLLLSASSLVFVAELFNTAIEFLGDAVAKGKYNENVGKAKDIASGAVLMASIFAVIIGIIVLLPPLISFLGLS